MLLEWFFWFGVPALYAIGVLLLLRGMRQKEKPAHHWYDFVEDAEKREQDIAV